MCKLLRYCCYNAQRMCEQIFLPQLLQATHIATGHSEALSQVACVCVGAVVVTPAKRHQTSKNEYLWTPHRPVHWVLDSHPLKFLYHHHQLLDQIIFWLDHHLWMELGEREIREWLLPWSTISWCHLLWWICLNWGSTIASKFLLETQQICSPELCIRKR